MSVFRSNFEITPKGVYYITRPNHAESPNEFELRLFDPGTRQTTVLNRFDAIETIGVAVSPDGQM